MKKYIAPELVVNQMMASQMIAVSLPLVEDEVSEGFVKEADELDMMNILQL